MNERMILLRSKAVRWFLLLLGLGAILALTGMNVFSLYDLRNRMIEGEEERRLDQIDEINSTIRKELYDPIYDFVKVELEPISATIRETGQFPEKIQAILKQIAQSNYYNGIYYTPEGTDPCNENAQVYVYDYKTHTINLSNDYPGLLCEGVGLVRTKTKIQLNDINNRWNNNLEFDAHRSLNLGLINLTEGKIIGYLTLPLNDEYIINELISPLLKSNFGSSDESGTIVWVYNWVSREVLATNDTTVQYERDLVDHREDFNSLFSNWDIRIAILQTSIAGAYNGTLIKNLIVLGVAVLFLGGALIFMFVTAQRERNLAALQANFLANVTHELKTPLAVMQAAGENISDGRVTEKSRLKQYGAHIYNESIRLRRMIEKLLDVARVDSGKVILKHVPRSLHDLMTNYLNANRDYIEQKGFEINYLPKDKDSFCMVDVDSFETIISNLTENAIKYSVDKKLIEYSISSDEKSVYLSITDHGIGIPKKALKNIFNKFFRVENPLSATTKGHGLGLSIVKKLVDLNNGKISVTSTFGTGTTFIIRFPKLVAENVSAESSEKANTQIDNNRNTEYVG